MPDRRLSSKKRFISRPVVTVLGLSLGVALFGASPVMAADLTASDNSDPSFTTGLFGQSRANLLGDIGGLRTSLANKGISFNLTETSEVLGNISGGVQKGFEYDGLTTASIQVDTSKAFGWDGGTFNVSALQLHGKNLSADNLANLQTVSGIESENTTRLWELWYQQSLFDDAADVKVGQQSIDSEFMASQSSALYLNTMMGWPMIPSADLYAGGPAYPLSSLGARVRANASKNVTILAGVFDDNPPGGPFSDDDQLRGAERSGTRFNLDTGALIIGEVQFAVNQPSEGDMAGGERLGRPARRLQTGLLVRHREVPRSALRCVGRVARHLGDGHRRQSLGQLQHLRRCRSGDLAARPERSAVALGLRASDVGAVGSQPDLVQHQCRRQSEGAAAWP